MRRIVSIFLILLAILVLLDQVFLNKDNTAGNVLETDELESDVESEEYGLKVGQKAPAFSLEQLDGKVLSLEELKGKKVLINFWASWCGPCVEEMPHLQKVYEELKGEKIEFLAINLTFGKETKEKAKEFADQKGITFPVLLDVGGKVQKLYEIVPIPTSYFIDEDGVIREKHLGPMDENEIREKLQEM